MSDVAGDEESDVVKQIHAHHSDSGGCAIIETRLREDYGRHKYSGNAQDV